MILNQEIMSNTIDSTGFLLEIKSLIEQSKNKVALAVNAEITLLYWNVGNRINTEVLGNERAEYGKQIVQSLSTQLSIEYGKGWGEKQLRQCMQFATVFPEKEIVYTLCRELSWSHLRLIIPTEEYLKRTSYIFTLKKVLIYCDNKHYIQFP